jgi:hypothetical protein
MSVNTTSRARVEPAFVDEHAAVSGWDGTVTRLPVTAVREADSPRSAGLDMAHARALAEVETELPPLVVHRATMRVIDGMHRLAAARLRGQTEVATRLFDGDDDEAFLLAVRLNVRHGMPLTIADRRAAAARIINTQPQLSNRYIAVTAGLSAKAVAALRSHQPERAGQGSGVVVLAGSRAVRAGVSAV